MNFKPLRPGQTPVEKRKQVIDELPQWEGRKMKEICNHFKIDPTLAKNLLAESGVKTFGRGKTKKKKCCPSASEIARGPWK